MCFLFINVEIEAFRKKRKRHWGAIVIKKWISRLLPSHLLFKSVCVCDVWMIRYTELLLQLPIVMESLRSIAITWWGAAATFTNPRAVREKWERRLSFRRWEEKSVAAVCPKMPEKVGSCMMFLSGEAWRGSGAAEASDSVPSQCSPWEEKRYWAEYSPHQNWTFYYP